MRLPPVKVISTSLARAVGNTISDSLSETPKHMNNFKEKVIYKKFNDLNSWYTRIIGLDEVKLYQDRVTSLQEKLLAAQSNRREIGSALALIRKKSNELQDQIHKVKRQEDLQKFLDLMKEETEVLKQEQEAQRMFQNCDREEREIFSAFTNAIRDSHEKQRAQLEYTKYIGLILSIAGSFLAFMYSTVKKNDLKRFIEDHMEEIAVKHINFTQISEPILNRLKDVEKRNEILVDAIRKNHLEVLKVVNSIGGSISDVKVDQPKNLVPEIVARGTREAMPDGEKILWFSVASLIGLIILRNYL